MLADAAEDLYNNPGKFLYLSKLAGGRRSLSGRLGLAEAGKQQIILAKSFNLLKFITKHSAVLVLIAINIYCGAGILY